VAGGEPGVEEYGSDAEEGDIEYLIDEEEGDPMATLRDADDI